MPTAIINRAGPRSVALETTLLAHGVPAEHAAPLARELAELVRARGAEPALVGILRGTPIVGLIDDELTRLLADAPPKVNAANLGVAIHRGHSGATTVSATIELAAAAGVRLFATGGIGGVHKDLASRLDISADLGALARFPVAVVASGVKSILDVESTREALETLGVPVVGYRTDRFPAFYLRESGAGVDARFDDAGDLARFVASELARSPRGILIANPIPRESELDSRSWERWLAEAERETRGSAGRDLTPAILSRVHALSGGATLRANLALVRSNAELAAELASRLSRAS